MCLVEKIKDHATANGFQGTLDNVIDVVSDALNESDCIVVVLLIHTYIKANGYALDYATFEDKYFSKWIGSRPKGR